MPSGLDVTRAASVFFGRRRGATAVLSTPGNLWGASVLNKGRVRCGDRPGASEGQAWGASAVFSKSLESAARYG